MTKKILFLVLTVSFLFSKEGYSQNTADSLRSLFQKAESIRKGDLSIQLAHHYLEINVDSCLYYSQIARTIGEKENNPSLIIRSYTKTGEVYQKQNQMKQAISAYLKGLELAEKHDEKSLCGTIYNGIAVCYFYQNNLQKAEFYLKKAAQSKKEANDYQYYAFISANLAVLQITNKSFNEAIKTLKDAEKTLLKTKQQQYLATVYNSLGAAYQTIKPDSCIYYYRKSLEASSKQKDYLIMMNATQNIGEYYQSKKDYATAIAYMKKAIAINELRPEDQYKPTLYQRISALYDSVNDFKNAYYYKNLENETRQRLFSVAKQKEIEELEIKYQSEKKEKEIQLNKQEIEKAKNQNIIVLFGAITLFIVAGFAAYLLLLRKKTNQKIEQEKLRLFENIVHEIRTPLTLIDGPVQVIKQHSGTVYQEELSLIERNSKKLIYLVNELLDVSKLKRGRYQLHYITGNIADFVENIINSFTGEAESKTIEIIREHNRNTEENYAFPSNVVEKIVANLVGNAVKYCPPKSKIQVNTHQEANTIIIEVSDNGPGIPKKEQKQVFRRFFRGKQASGIEGTGIGLSLVKELVELAGGMIHFQSSASGTTFVVTIPVKENTKSEETITTSPLTDLPVLLLAEDDADTAAFTISVLKDSFTVVHVQNGQLAMEAIRENLPDIVLSDVMMPEKDGIELLRDIRSNELSSHLPVILFSAKGSLESKLEGLHHGADAYIAKPFLPEELKLTIRNLFTTVQRNKENYKASINSEKTFEERIRSQNAYVNKVIEQIIRNIDNSEYSVTELSDDMAVSRSQLHRKLTALTGFSTTGFISMIRLEKAKDLLLKNEGNITEIAYKCGFNSQSYFTKSFTEYFGKSPSQYTVKS